MIEVKSGVRDPEQKVKIRNLVKMATREGRVVISVDRLSRNSSTFGVPSKS
jgi:hypothetical protein